VIVTRSDFVAGVAIYVLTSIPAFLGALIGTTPGVMRQQGPVENYLHGLCHYDGGHFESIVEHGHLYDPDKASTVAFFPGYPLLARAARDVLGWSTRFALVVTSNVAFVAALVLLSSYLRIRYPDDSDTTRLIILSLVGLWPAGYFFRMAYSESLFLLTIVLLLLGFTRRWPAVVLALIAGAATGVRLVGIVATGAVIIHALAEREHESSRKRLAIALGLGLLGCWGLFGYMAYQQVKFDTPIAFALVQKHWSFHAPLPGEMQSKLVRLATFEPIWNMYVSGSSRYWGNFHATGDPFFGIMFWNPILFVIAVLSVVYGCCRGWFTKPEAILGIGLLLIPYVTRADEISMGSQARFVSVVVPMYVVLGRLLGRLPPAATWLVFVAMTSLLLLWSALFAAVWPLC
jgi:hypothetical protein